MCLGTPPLSNCVTTVPLACVAAVVLFAPLIQPVKLLLVIPVYEICSPPMNNVPVALKPVEDVRVIILPEVTITLLIVSVKAALIVIVVPLTPVTVVASGIPVPTIVFPTEILVLDATVKDVELLEPDAVVAKIAPFKVVDCISSS